MEMTLTVNGLNDIAKDMKDRARRFPLAVYNALNVTGNDIIRNEKTVINTIFDRPTPFIQNSIEKKIYTTGDMTLTVWVDPFNTAAIKVLEPHIFSKPRALKASEQWMRSAGILPAGKYIVPAQEQFLDQYGNFRGSEMVQILSALKAFPDIFRMNKTTKSRGKSKSRYFVKLQGNTPIGIWERIGPGYAKPVLYFVSQPQYKKIYDFHGIADSTAVATFQKNFFKMVDGMLSRDARNQ